MIITSSDEWTDLYASIREESNRSEEKHVNIYASSSDADSVCALRILEVRRRCPDCSHLHKLGGLNVHLSTVLLLWVFDVAGSWPGVQC
jgi:hypothetical protein